MAEGASYTLGKEINTLTLIRSSDTIELSVLGHYLSSSLSSFQNCVNFVQSEIKIAKSSCRHIFDLAAAALISSTEYCPEWSGES